jgi:hypothetical protein
VDANKDWKANNEMRIEEAAAIDEEAPAVVIE